MKRIISLICALTLVFACIPHGISFAEDIDILVNETFEDYPTNGSCKNITVKSGYDARVVERAKGDKAFYAKAEGNSVIINVPFTKVYDKTVFSYDLKIDGSNVKGYAAKLSSGTSRTLLTYGNDGSVTLEDGMRIALGSRSDWNTYTFCVDYENKLYDMYINGKQQLKNRKFYTAPANNKRMDFEFSCIDESGVAEIYLDNIRVYEGAAPASANKFAKKSYNSEVLPFEKQDTGEKVYDTVFIDSNSNSNLPGLVYYPVNGVIAQWHPMEEGGVPYVYFMHEGGTEGASYADLSLSPYDGLDKYVYQTDIYIVKNEGTIIGARTYSDDGMCNLMMIDASGNLQVMGVNVGKLPYGEWVNIAVAVDLQKGISNAYINRKLVAEKLEVKGTSAWPARIRMGSVTSKYESEVYFNKIKVYDGMALRTFADSGTEATSDDAYIAKLSHTDSETDNMAKKLLGTDVAFMVRSGKFYAHGEKYDYKDYGAPAYMADSAVMVDAKVFTYATDIELSENGGSVSLNGKKINSEVKDGILFVNASEAAKAAGKSVYDTDNREFIVISKSDKGYTNAVLSRDNMEDIDVIWRYLQFDRPSGDELYNTLKNSSMYKSHPRLLVKKDEIPALRNRVESDSELRNVLNEVIDTCDSYFEKEPQKRTFMVASNINILFSSCYNIKIRLFDLCTAYLITGDTKYADRAWLEMENVLKWEDWNTSGHFLDSGELVPGMAYAYDVLYDYLTDEQKQFFRDKVEEHYLDFAVGVYTGESNYTAMDFRHRSHNWGAVTGAAMYMMASVLVDEEGEDSLLTHKCKYLMSNVMQTFELLATGIAPEGTWYEGAGYFEYVQQHTAWFLEVTDNMYDYDYNFLTSNGLKDLSKFLMYIGTNIGEYNYSSVTEPPSPRFCPEAFIYAGLTDDAYSMKLYNRFRKTIGAKSFLPQYLLFYDPDLAAKASDDNLSLDHYYSTMGISSMRESWDDPEGLYVGIRSGANVGSDHQDKGSFIFETGGVRWSIDLGRNANLTMDYLLRTESHSGLVINPSAKDVGQTLDQDVPRIASESKERGAYMVYDMQGAYSDRVDSYKRGFLVSDERQTLTIRDELSLKGESELLWNFITRTDIEIAPDGKSATLKSNDKTLNVTGYCSTDDWKFEVIDTLEPTGGWVVDSWNFSVEEQQKFTSGVKRLVLRTTGSGNVDIAVKLAPADDEVQYAPVENIKIANWSIPDGKIPPKAELQAIYADGKPMLDFVPAVKTYNMHMVYGSAVPYFTADCSNGTVAIKQASDLMDYALFTVTMPDGRQSEYKIYFEVEPRITDVYIDTKPQLGLPSGHKLLSIANVSSDHEPEEANPATNVADGDLKTRWASDQRGSYVEVDLGQVYDISGLALAFSEGDKRNYNYSIWVSENKMDYKRVYTGYSLGGTLDYEYTPLPVKARYVRYVGFQHTKGIWNSITEVRPVVAE